MRWPTLVLSVTLFCSLSFVNAIPHEVDEKRHWLHKRQGTSTGSSPPVIPPTATPNPSNSVVLPTSTPDAPSSRPSSSPSSSTQRPPTSTTSQPAEGDSSSTISSSSSSSSVSSSSTSTSRTSSSTTPTVTSRPNPGNTSYRVFSSTRARPSDTKSAGGNVQTGTGSGSSFLKNKGAMGATFALLGLVGVGVIAGTIFYLRKRSRQRKRQDDLDTYFEKLPPTTWIKKSATSNQNAGGSNEYGLGPSAADLTSPSSAQAFMPRDVHYGATSQYPSAYPDQYPNHGGLEYPPERGSVIERPSSIAPGTAYAAAMSQRGQYNYRGEVEDPNTVPNHPFADPESRLY